jgi:hypothetical protein
MESPPNIGSSGTVRSYQCVDAHDPVLSEHLDYPKIDGAPLWRWSTLAVFDNQQDCKQAAQFQRFDSFIRNK